MQQVFAAFGIDWRLLIINAVNFGILMLVLWYFLYKPLTAMLETRRKKVEQGVKDAQAAATVRAEVEGSRGAILAKAGQEADDVLQKARASGTARERELIAQGESAAAVMLSDAKAQANELKVQAIEESKQEVAKLIVLGMEKAMQK